MAMNNVFADLNILHNPEDQKTTIELVRLAVQLGYDIVAINIDVGDISASNLGEEADSTPATGKGKKKKKQRQKLKVIPAPFKVDSNLLDFSSREPSGKQQFRQYSRITITLDDPDIVHQILKHPTVREYDLVAVYPRTEAIFSTIINKAEIDMISLDMSERAQWVSKGRLVQMAIEKGLAFEVTYSLALSDSSHRRNSFCTARELVRACGRKKEGIIFASRASKPIELRAPFDAANMSLLFGITNADDGRKAVGMNAKRMLLCAETKRKTLKGAMAVEEVASVASKGLLDKLARIPEFRMEMKAIPQDDDDSEDDKRRKKPRNE